MTIPDRGARHLLPSVKHVLLLIGQHRLDPRNDGGLLCQCHCRSHVSSPFWPLEDVVQDIPFTNKEDDDTGQDYLCPRTRAPISPISLRHLRPSRHTTTRGRVTSFAYKEGGISVPVLRCLETKEMQRVGVQCSGSRFPSSVPRVCPHDGCPISVCRLGLYHEAHSPPVTDTVHAANNIVEVVCDTTSPGC